MVCDFNDQINLVLGLYHGGVRLESALLMCLNRRISLTIMKTMPPNLVLPLNLVLMLLKLVFSPNWTNVSS